MTHIRIAFVTSRNCTRASKSAQMAAQSVLLRRVRKLTRHTRTSSLHSPGTSTPCPRHTSGQLWQFAPVGGLDARLFALVVVGKQSLFEALLWRVGWCLSHGSPLTLCELEY